MWGHVLKFKINRMKDVIAGLHLWGGAQQTFLNTQIT